MVEDAETNFVQEIAADPNNDAQYITRIKQLEQYTIHSPLNEEAKKFYDHLKLNFPEEFESIRIEVESLENKTKEE